MRYGGVCAAAECGASARRAAARDGALSRERKRARLPRHLWRESPSPFDHHGAALLRSFTLSDEQVVGQQSSATKPTYVRLPST